MTATLALLSTLALGAALTAQSSAPLPRSVQQGSFELPISATQAFPLFSPEGERPWAGPHWDPKPISPAGNRVAWEKNSVFTTGDGADKLTWWTVDLDRAAHRVEYIHVGQNRAARITVHVVAVGDTSSRVEVTYDIVALNQSGAAYVQQADAEQMKHKMLHWKSAIEAAIAKGLPTIAE